MPAPVVHIPSVGGAVAITYNLPGVPTGLKLTPDVIADIFLGKITSWNDPRIKGINPKVNLRVVPSFAQVAGAFPQKGPIVGQYRAFTTPIKNGS